MCQVTKNTSTLNALSSFDKWVRQQANEPEWLSTLRRKAWSHVKNFTFPSGKEEIWRYTDISLLDLNQFDLFSVDNHSRSIHNFSPKLKSAREIWGTTNGGGIVQQDGYSSRLELAQELHSSGVVFSNLEQAASNSSMDLKTYLGKLVIPSDIFTACALAFHHGGVFLYVPASVTLDKPITALHWVSRPGTAWFPRNTIIVEPHAKVLFYEYYASDNLKGPTLICPVTEVFVGEGAQVGWVTVQNYGEGIRHLAKATVQLSREARLNTLWISLGADYSRSWLEVLLAGENAESKLLGLYLPRAKQQFEHWTVQDHLAPRTRSDLLYHGVLNDESRSLYDGTIRVRPAACRTDAYQANHNLLLSSRAKVDTNPQLEIANNDVRCTHGATVGPIDESQRFYLMSRGLSAKTAEELIVFGFLQNVLERSTVWLPNQKALERIVRSQIGFLS